MNIPDTQSPKPDDDVIYQAFEYLNLSDCFDSGIRELLELTDETEQ